MLGIFYYFTRWNKTILINLICNNFRLKLFYINIDYNKLIFIWPTENLDNNYLGKPIYISDHFEAPKMVL